MIRRDNYPWPIVSNYLLVKDALVYKTNANRKGSVIRNKTVIT